MSVQPAYEPQCSDRSGAIELVIEPRTRDLGGFDVRRVLPSAQRRMVGPFIFFDHMGPAEFSGRGKASTCGRIRTSGSPPSPICSRARSCTATASASRAADPARRRQLDDRGPRHRALGAHARRSVRATARACTASRPGWRCRATPRRPTPSFVHHPADDAAGGRAARARGARDRRPALRRALAGPTCTRRCSTSTRARRRARGCRCRTSTRSARVYVVEGAVELRRRRASRRGQLLVLRAGRGGRR